MSLGEPTSKGHRSKTIQGIRERGQKVEETVENEITESNRKLDLNDKQNFILMISTPDENPFYDT